MSVSLTPSMAELRKVYLDVPGDSNLSRAEGRTGDRYQGGEQCCDKEDVELHREVP
jgi:hypothetical protein